MDVTVGGAKLERSAAVGQADGAPVCAVADLLDAGHAAHGEKGNEPVGVERGAVGQPQRQRAAVLGLPVSTRADAQGGGRGGEDLLDGRVELADALKASCKGNAGDRHGGRLEQDSGGLRALSAGEGEWTGADSIEEPAVDVALGVAQARGKTAHALAVDNAVGDQPHGAPDEVGANIPCGRAGRGVGTTALTGSKAGGLGSSGRGEEAHVLAFGGARGATGAAVDAGAGDAAEDPAVKARVGCLDRLPESIGVEDHTVTVAHRTVHV